jgi:hypothetical protein
MYRLWQTNNGLPVKRVNADSIHGAVLEHIRRVAEHPTRCREVIRDAVKAMPTPDRMDAERDGLNCRLREVDKRIKKIMATIEAGGSAVRSLVSRLQELELDQDGIVEQQRQLSARIAETHIQRPDPDRVQAWFRDFLRLWDAATEEERQRLMPMIVGKVEMHEKERGFCQLLFTAQNPRSLQSVTSRNVVINCAKGAGNSPSSIYSAEPMAIETLRFRFKALKGGRNRTKIPRPGRQTSPIF